jgi:hypothetical protein
MVPRTSVAPAISLTRSGWGPFTRRSLSPGGPVLLTDLQRAIHDAGIISIRITPPRNPAVGIPVRAAGYLDCTAQKLQALRQ